jgi:hypothetical protein
MVVRYEAKVTREVWLGRALILVLSLALVLALVDTVNAEPSSDGTSADNSVCKIRHHGEIELGLPGSGKPQAVREVWRVTKGCNVVRVDVNETFEPEDSRITESLLTSGCNGGQIDHKH